METLKGKQAAFEIGVVIHKRVVDDIGDSYGYDCDEVLVYEFQKVGLIVDRVAGLHDEFLKVHSSTFNSIKCIVFIERI